MPSTDGGRTGGLGWIAVLGPGLAVAATGVGAGDLLAAMLAGAGFGTTLLWVIAVGAVLKLALNEGVARWQLATGTTLVEGWGAHLGILFQLGFLVYLVLWSVIVAGGLMSACGVAAHALLPQVPIAVWGALHSLAALALVWFGRYDRFESTMKALIGLMVVTLLASVVLVGPDLVEVLRGLAPTLPRGSASTVLSLMGGVGGSVTMLSYGYWIREKGWTGSGRITTVRRDLGVGYLLTGVFGAAMLVLAATALAGFGAMPGGSAGLIACADALGEGTAHRLGASTGVAARWIFLVGLWAAVFTSTLGVWQGVPYLFADFWNQLRRRTGQVDEESRTYRGYLLFLALPPMLMLVAGRPVWVIKLYTLTGGLFMPVLAASLLWLTTRRPLMGGLRSRWPSIAAIAAALALFAAIAARQVIDLVSGG
ncbi:MAG: Nramp family divalent metal transporter [Thermoanaerobaculales bacterium]|jgi:Mn2+/Fe2+ NRAMP family transporter|nr:Nramp family divalent metal transporter [Thermoanaerobaculales bacterium]